MVRLAVNGSLLQLLTKTRENPYINVEKKQVPFTHIDKVRIARDIANGMSHLATKKVGKLSLKAICVQMKALPHKGDFVAKL